MARTKLSSSDRTPLYEQLAADLRYRIRGGEFDADQRIPSKAAIAADYDVSLRTVDTAVGAPQGGRHPGPHARQAHVHCPA